MPTMETIAWRQLPLFWRLIVNFDAIQHINPLQPGVAYLYPLKSNIDKQHQAVMG